MSKFLIIQTAFIGDVILATALVEKLAAAHPEAKIHFLLRKGNEQLLENNPHIDRVLIWDKTDGKLMNLFKLIKIIRGNDYDTVVNIHRFGSSGLLTALSGARTKIGFTKNPWSIMFTRKIEHSLDNIHEVERNQKLIAHLTNAEASKPKLYPSKSDFDRISGYQGQTYICIAPNSIWFTKQLPELKWLELIGKLKVKVFLIGGPMDRESCTSIRDKSEGDVVVLAGDLTFLQTAALMRDAQMNYVNDSAPMHIGSAMDAPVTAIYCSTVPEFGFGPLSTNSRILQTDENLSCRPCGLHGYTSCPKGHFDCASKINMEELIA